MAAMLPPAIPYRIELIYLTGVLEFLGALGVWIPGLMRLTGVCLILMLVGILPANIYSAINHVEFGGHAAGPAYLLIRVPFQLFVIWWTYFATEQRWFQRQGESLSLDSTRCVIGTALLPERVVALADTVGFTQFDSPGKVPV